MEKIEISKIFKSDKSTMKLIEPILQDLKTKISIAEDKFFNLVIAVTEAVNNAITHGNKEDSSKSVHLDLIATNKEIAITVKDEGSGFNPTDVDDCRTPENIMKSSGRGVFIINTIMDKVEIKSDKDGTTIDMKLFL